MSAEAIKLVTLAIASRLKAALNAAGGDQTTFVGPLDDQGAKTARLVLFLHRVVPNQGLRNTEHTVPMPPANLGESPGQQIYNNALALDLHYLITVGPKDQVGDAESLRLLGYVMQALNDTPLLVGLPVGGEIVRLSLDPASSEEMSRVWALFPTVNYRTSVLYLASPVWIDPAIPPVQAPSVVDQGVLAGQGGEEPL